MSNFPSVLDVPSNSTKYFLKNQVKTDSLESMNHESQYSALFYQTKYSLQRYYQNRLSS